MRANRQSESSESSGLYKSMKNAENEKFVCDKVCHKRESGKENKRLNKRRVPSGVLQERKNLAGNQNFTISPFITAMILLNQIL